MYYVQWKIDASIWQGEKKYHSLGAALREACVEAQMVSDMPHRVIKIKENGKVKVLAKFKPLRDA